MTGILAAYMTQPITRPDPNGITGVGVSDAPGGGLGDPDLLGFDPIARALVKYVRHNATRPPLAIAINGAWGSGKSTVMRRMETEFRKARHRSVWFNAWHYEQEDHLLASLLINIRDQAIPPAISPRGWLFRLRLLIDRVVPGRNVDLTIWAMGLIIIAPLAVMVAEALGESAPVNAWAQAITWAVHKGPESLLVLEKMAPAPWVASVFGLMGLVMKARVRLASAKLSPAKLLTLFQPRSRIADLDKSLSFRHRFADEFRQVTDALGEKTLIIFIDDLDRCRPNSVMQVLEAVNFLVSAGRCCVVFGHSRPQVEAAVGLGFKDIAAEGAAPAAESEEAARNQRAEFASRYLDKLINIEVHLPQLDSDEASKMLLDVATWRNEPTTAVEISKWRLPLSLIIATGLIGLAVWFGIHRLTFPVTSSKSFVAASDFAQGCSVLLMQPCTPWRGAGLGH